MQKKILSILLALAMVLAMAPVSVFAEDDLHVHEYVEEVTAPTCTERGYTTYTCVDCGFSFKGNYVDIFHTPTDDCIIIAPTCAEEGYTKYTCSICGELYNDDYIASLGHVDENADLTCDVCNMFSSGDFWFNLTDAQVGETVTVTIGTDFDGFKAGSIQINFNAEYLEYLDCRSIHSPAKYGLSIVAGVPIDGDDCVNCGMMTSYYISETRNFIDLEFKVLKEGSSTLSVNVLEGDWSADSIPVGASITIDTHEHEYAEEITAPTCIEQGYTTYTCLCGDSYVDDYVDASDAYHTYESVVTPNELEVEGYTTYTCTICGDSFVDDYTPALHSYPDGSLNCDICGKYAFEYEINNGEVTITDCDESIIGDVVIPDTIDGYPVTTIGSYALNHCNYLTGVTIPDSVTSAEYGTFYFCTSLESVVIGSGITSICDEMFYGCSSLKSITIPDNVTEIGGGAFFTSGIEAIKIPSSVTTIGPEAFAHCSRLVSVELSDGVTTIANGAFFGCENLESIIIPASVTTFSFETFDHCEKVKIYGYAGSAAETYANENGIEFVALCKHETTVVKNAVDATCVADGYTGDIHCEACDELLTSGEALTATGHTEEVVANKDATCTETGLTEGKKCSICDEILVVQTEIAETGHTEEVIPEVPATYTETGLTEGKKCSVCDEILVAQEVIPMLEMPNLKPSAENITVTDSIASVTAENSVEDVIKSVENENVQILDKDGKELAKESFVGTGSKIQILDKEGIVLSEYEVMVKSDVDGNGKVTPADARLALRASTNLDNIEGVFETAANYDDKDTVSPSDARMILRKAAGLE